MSKDLRGVVIMDYQNVHLTGHGLFGSTRLIPKHETLVDPLMFAQQLLRARNSRQRDGMATAVLREILVFRGQPSSEHDSKGYARSLAQQSQWERDPRVRVTLRPRGLPREKGVDVQCALATVREAQRADVDLVILATSDSDLAPAIDEVLRLGCAKVETFCWYDVPSRRGYQLHPSDRARRVWNTRLDEAEFRRTWDPQSY